MFSKTRIIIVISILIATIATAILDLYTTRRLIIHALENNYHTPFSLRVLTEALVLLAASAPLYIALKLRQVNQAGLVTALAATITLLLVHLLTPLLQSLISPYAWIPSLFINWSLGLLAANYVLNHHPKNTTHPRV